MVRAPFVAAVVTVLAASSQTPGQAPVFRSTAERVEVHAVVTDRSGAAVRGLTRADFQVAEDGKPQTVVEFSFIDLPVPTPATPEARAAAVAPISEVASNAPVSDRRLYALVLDASNVDSSRSTVVKRLARQFIEDQIGPNDLAAVVQLGRTSVNQPFTSNKTLLIGALDQFIGHKIPSATMNIAQDALLRPQNVPQDFAAGDRSNEARRMLEALKQICESLGATRGYRRSLILFSEGVDADTSDLIGEDKRPAAGGQGLTHEAAKTAGLVLQAQADLFAAARRAGVAVYPIDPRGNTMGEDLQMQAGSAAPGVGIITEVQRGQGVLRTLADQTGGLAVVGTGAFKAGFDSIVQANSSYYVLAYAPTNTSRDGSFRRISVAVTRPGVTVSARKGYVAPLDAPPAASPSAPSPAPKGVSPRMREILASALPVGGLPVRLMGGPIRPASGKMLVALVLEIDGKALPLKEQGGALTNHIEIAFLAIDASGKVLAGNRDAGNLSLPPEARAVIANGLRYVVEFPAPAGRFQVRMGAHETAGDGGGSALLDLEVPDPTKAPLSIGTILLTSKEAASVQTTGAYPQVRTLLAGPPSASRDLARSDTLAVFASVFDSTAKRTDTVEVAVTVQGPDGREVLRTAVTKTGAEVAPSEGGYGHSASIPLAGFSSGRHVLTVTAASSAGKRALRSVPFAVR